MVQEALSKKGVKKFVGSSGGNAGVAMAVAAKGEQSTVAGSYLDVPNSYKRNCLMR